MGRLLILLVGSNIKVSSLKGNIPEDNVRKTPSGVSLIVEFEASQLEAMPLSRLAPQPNQIGVMEVIWADPSRDWKICTTASPWIGLGSGTVLLHLKR